MTFQEKIAVRIRELCRIHNLTIAALAKRSGMAPSTIYQMLKADSSSNPRITSIFKICGGFGITLRDFFASEIFNR